jgi:hypothetical protein
MQRLLRRWLQVLQSVCGLLRVQLRLLSFVGSLPLRLLVRALFRLCQATQRVYQRVGLFRAALPARMRVGRLAVDDCMRLP